MHFIKLLIPAHFVELFLLFILARAIKVVCNYLSISLSDRADDFEECQLLLLLLGQIFAIEFDKLEKDSFE